jgi:hypothetical protein
VWLGKERVRFVGPLKQRCWALCTAILSLEERTNDSGALDGAWVVEDVIGAEYKIIL